jgi:hypothetical protein
MNFEADELLDTVDEWKFQLHEKLKSMTPEESAAFWKQVRDKARARGLPLAGPDVPARREGERSRRATG